MKQIRLYLLVAAAAIPAAVALVAQTASPQAAKSVSVQDGGVNESLESIFISPIADAPFTCMLHTEWVRTMGDGGTLTIVNQRKIARQSNGRFYQERWMLVPKNGPMESRMTHIQIADPNSHTLYTCVMGMNVCRVTNYGGETATVYKPEVQPSGVLPNGQGSVTNESLGKDATQHVETEGTRITRNFNAWALGNDRAFTITREFWFAPSLGMNLISKISDPRFGSQSFTVTDLVLGEPDPQLFETPKGYVVKDDRTPAAQ
jgi:hypothetical protein